MRICQLQTVQLYDCPNYTKRTLFCLPQAQAQFAFEEVATFEKSPPRFTDSAIQTLRETGVQMCRRTGTRTEVLSFGQFAWGEAQAGIYPQAIQGTGRDISGQFSFVARDRRRDLQHQSRVTAPQRTFVRRNLVHLELICCPICRHQSGRHIGCQHARNLAHAKRSSSFFVGGRK